MGSKKSVPPKLFARMTDLLVMQTSGDVESGRELDVLCDQVGWPWSASKEQVREWNDTYLKAEAKAGAIQ